MKTLFEISNDIHALADLLEETGGEVTPETEAAIDQWFAEVETDRDAKIDNYCALIKHLEATAKARQEESKRLQSLAKTDENSADRLKRRLHMFFQIHGIPKVETLRFKVRRQANGGKHPVILDEHFQRHPEELPEKYRRVIFEPNLDVIREDLMTLAAVSMEEENADAAADLAKDLSFAALGERGEHLRIA